jgi:hypothetical protein
LAVYDREKIDSGLIVAAGASSAAIVPYATQTYSSSNVFGNYNAGTGTFNATQSGTTTSHKQSTARKFTQ